MLSLIEQYIGMVGLKTENKYLQELTSIRLKQETIHNEVDSLSSSNGIGHLTHQRHHHLSIEKEEGDPLF
jgi:hypothetical protein